MRTKCRRRIEYLFLLATLSCAAQTKPEFEVATIKPSPPPGATFTIGCSGGPFSPDPTRFRCTNASLTFLVTYAFSVPRWGFKAPASMEDQKFELVANVPPGVTGEEFQGMFQNLLVQRFHLTYHRVEERVQGFELVVAKGGPKLTASRGPSEDGAVSSSELAKDGYPAVPGTGETNLGNRARIHYPDQTMDFFAQIVSGRVDGPVVNLTVLPGKYDISMYFVGDATNEDGPTFLYALTSQLGLKLEAKKVSASVFVVDHADKMPADN